MMIVRPCRPGIESYVSSGRSLTLTQVFDDYHGYDCSDDNGEDDLKMIIMIINDDRDSGDKYDDHDKANKSNAHSGYGEDSYHDDHGDCEDDNDHGDDQDGGDGDDNDAHNNFCTQTLGAGSVEEQLAFEARYEFVTKVCHRHQQVFHGHQKFLQSPKSFYGHQKVFQSPSE